MAYILRAAECGKASMPKLAEQLGIKCYTSDQSIPADDYAFRWACTSKDLGSTKVINKISAIEATTQKGTFRKLLADLDLAPRTWMTFTNFLDDVEKSGEKAPRVIVRPSFHEKSQSIYDCSSLSETLAASTNAGSKYYISEFIAKTQEFRAFVCQGRIAWMIEKHPKDSNEVSWGCVTEGSFDYVDWSSWPTEVSRVSLLSMKQSGLDFGAVDVVVKDGKAYVMEINTAPYLTTYYRTCIAKCFKYIIKNGRQHFPDVSSWDWKAVIHPAVQVTLESI